MSSEFPPSLGGDHELVQTLDPAERRALGVYLTPEPLARLMASVVRPQLEAGRHLIDPAAGTGRLLKAAVTQFGDLTDRARIAGQIRGVEHEERLATWTDGVLSEVTGVERLYCRVGDALLLLDPEQRRAQLGRTHFGAVIANPPYVREKHNRQVFAALRKTLPDWATWYRPRQDLQQLFLILGILMLEPEGELVYLVNSYWLHSDSGQPLRELLAERMAVLSIVDFGDQRLFKDAPGQHNLLIHARHSQSLSKTPTTRYIKVTERSPGGLEGLCRDLSRVMSGDRAPGYLNLVTSSEPIGHGPRRRWYRPGPHDGLLTDLEASGVALGRCFHTHQGVVSGADRVTRRNLVSLDIDPPLGAGIFVLSEREVNELDLSPEERRLLRRVYRARQIQPFEVDEGQDWIIYLTWRDDLAGRPALRRHLERFRSLLAKRREVVQGKMPWFALHWPRMPELFDRPRIVTPRRSVETRFAMGKQGFCEQSDIAMITEPSDDETRLRALLVVLNSGPIARWSQFRGKHKGQIREFFGRALEEIPIPRAARDDPKAFAELARFARRDRIKEGNKAVEKMFDL